MKDAQKKGKKAKKAAAKYTPGQQKKGLGFGGVALIVVVCGRRRRCRVPAYQTLRADDDLRVADDADSAEKPAA